MPSEDIYEIMQSLPLGYVEMDTDLNIRYINTYLMEQMGYGVEDLKRGVNILDVMIDKEKVGKNIQNLLSGELLNETYYTAITKTGEKKHVLIRSALMKEDERTLGVRSIVIDKTDQVLAEQALKRSEERFRLIIEDLPVGYSESNKELYVTYINKELSRMTGYSKDDVERGVQLTEVLPEQEKLKRNYKKGLAGERYTPETYEMICKNGKKIQTLIKSSPIIEKGKPEGLRSVIFDVTQMVEAEQRLQDSLKEKEHLLQEVHHRVKNNMQIILSILELQKGHPVDEAYFPLIEATQRRIKTMALMYEHLYQKSDISSVGIRDYFFTLLSYMKQLYSSRLLDITYHYEIEDISFPIEIAIPCGLVLTELFSNVCRHAFPEETVGRIAIRCGVDGDCYHLEVEDNGKGCEDTDVLLQGETLGFQLVKALTEQINGDMEVSSRGGLQIRVRFPSPVIQSTGKEPLCLIDSAIPAGDLGLPEGL